MAKRKVSGGKRIDTWEVTVEGKTFEIEVYMTKVTRDPYADSMPPKGSTMFVALNEEFDLRHEGLDINAIQKAIEKEIRERAVVTWERKLLVTVEGTRRPDDSQGWYDPEAICYPFGKTCDPSYGTRVKERSVFGSSGGRLTSSHNVSFAVEGIEITTVSGEKKWRYTKVGNYAPNGIDDGWPEVGQVMTTSRHDIREKRLQSVVGMVDDTPENRAALLAIVEAMETLLSKLDSLLTHDNLQATLTRVLATGANLTLVSNTEEK